MRRVSTVADETERTQDGSCKRRSKRTTFVARRGIAVPAALSSSARARHALGSLPSVGSATHFKRNRLADAWSNAIPWKGRDVHEDLFLTLR
jgi:hypothetical protein